MLYKSGKLSGILNDGRVRYASVCPKEKSCKAQDMDFPGHDIDSVSNVETWEECSVLCTKNWSCSFWTWVDENYSLNPAIIHKCHLKNRKSSASPVTGLVSGVSGCAPVRKNSPCVSKNTGLVGHLIGSVLDVPSWEKCSSLCNEKSDCYFWEWVDDSFTLHPASIHKCYLKNRHSGLSSITGLISGPAGCKPADIPRCEAVYEDTDLPGNDIDSVLNVATAEECRDLCIQNTACTFWTWVGGSYTLNPAIIHKCHLKNGSPVEASVAGLVSGAATC